MLSEFRPSRICRTIHAMVVAILIGLSNGVLADCYNSIAKYTYSHTTPDAAQVLREVCITGSPKHGYEDVKDELSVGPTAGNSKPKVRSICLPAPNLQGIIFGLYYYQKCIYTASKTPSNTYTAAKWIGKVTHRLVS